MDDSGDYLSTDLVEECLVDHFVLAHNVSPDELYAMKLNVVPEEWVNFLVRAHYILHMIEKHGEYHDDQFDFKASDLQ